MLSITKSKLMKPHDPVHILLAEDDENDRFFFEASIRKLPIVSRFATVANPEELRSYLDKNMRRLPNILFMDINMPRQNGTECLMEIKQDVRLLGMPVVAYSSSISDATIDALYKAGAHYYMHKCDYPDLAGCIETIISLIGHDPDQPIRDKFIIQPLEV